MSTEDPKRRLSDWFRQWPPLRKFLLGRSGIAGSHADEMAHEVFLRLLRYERVDLIEHPQAYLFKIALNVVAELAIRAQHRTPHQPKWLTTLVVREQPKEAAIHDDAQQELERAINTLPARQREVLKLLFSEGLAETQIAARLGQTPRSVRRQLARSYEKLRHELDPDLLEAMIHGRD